jgi:DNA-binding NarL/FixJ family response regulator
MSADKIKVLFVDDAKDIVDLYEAFVNSEPDMECVGTLTSADELPDVIKRLEPLVVVLDLRMPGRSSIEVARELAKQRTKARIIFFSGLDDPQVELEAFEAGAWGLISKDCDPTEVISTIRAVAAGEIAFPRR